MQDATPKLSAFMLFAKKSRSKVQECNPGIDFTTLGKKLGEMWSKLPNPEKMKWKRKALRLSDRELPQQPKILDQPIFIRTTMADTLGSIQARHVAHVQLTLFGYFKKSQLFVYILENISCLFTM